MEVPKTAKELLKLPVNQRRPILEKQVEEAVKLGIYCHKCGNLRIVHENPAEGYWCPECGSSDQDE